MEHIQIRGLNNIKEFINIIVSYHRIFVLIGTITAIMIHRKEIRKFLKKPQKKISDLSFLFPEERYVIGGWIAMAVSRILTTAIFQSISKLDINHTVPNAEATGYRLVDLLWQTSGYTSLVMFMGYIIAGICLTISAGDRRWVNTSKFFYLITTLYFLVAGAVRFGI